MDRRRDLQHEKEKVKEYIWRRTSTHISARNVEARFSEANFVTAYLVRRMEKKKKSKMKHAP